ncbi:haloacid dehalogenase-like hydrolase [Stappia indica]|uniref:Haloacid dehalogenase-like hydrolase n=1 Tax=Stappia indica TaxID=538381 RepID=A0A285RYC4_9HYPH|nr:HAD family hydrolase [Stappia indica]SOB99192.1 haloacid dehalogenase-like hydrolase [Stappia indica]
MIRAAIVYDFDGTLSPGSMQQHSFIPSLGYTDHSAFWREVKAEAKQRDGDEILAYMQHMIRDGHVTRDQLRSHGEKLPLFKGVFGWFSRFNEYAYSRHLLLEHYVISSGNLEMIEGCSIAKEFKHIFASSFAYDEGGHAIWPSVAVNFTNKTQFLFRINKGIMNSWDGEAVNRWIPMQERDIPFERMIFIGDGDTDIPSMKMIRHQGGTAIAVFDPEQWEEMSAQNKVHRLIAEDRANYVAPADYRQNSQLDVTVRGILGRIAREAGVYKPEG